MLDAIDQAPSGVGRTGSRLQDLNRIIILFVAPSFTAQTMALQRAFEAAWPKEQRLFDDPLAKEFLSGPLRAVALLARVPLAGRLIPRAYDLVWPGPRPSAVARTRLIDDTLAEALTAGIRQVVVLGAGFDDRPWRLPGIERARVIEIDRGDTQEAKITALRRSGRSIGHMDFVAIDFERDNLPAAVRSAGFSSDELAAFLWEGVTNYLSAGAVDRTLAAIRSLAAQDSLLLFTYVHRGVLDGSAHFPEARRWVGSVARAGEPWTFGLVPERLSDHLATRGFELVWDVSTADAGRRYFPAVGRRDQASELYHVALARVACRA